MPSVTFDGKGGHELKLEKKNGPIFSSFNAMPAKITKKTMASAEI